MHHASLFLYYSCQGFAHHHVFELVELNLAITVLVNLLDHFFDFLGVIIITEFENAHKLLLIDRSIFIGIKGTECILQLLNGQSLFLSHGSSHELTEFDRTIVIKISITVKLYHIILSESITEELCMAIDKFLLCYATTVVCIQCVEYL